MLDSGTSPTCKVSMRASGAAALLWILAAAPLPAPPSDPPNLLSVTPDGFFEDWATVLANPASVTVDGDGSTIPCNQSSDRDCVVADPSHDLQRFAWTYDPTNLYLYFERYDGGSGNDTFWFHADLDRDGLMGTADRLLRVTISSSDGEVNARLSDYVPADPLGDPMVDGLGFADGYAPPGEAGSNVDWTAPPAFTADTDQRRIEIAVPWSAFGLPGPTPFEFHAGADSACCSPHLARDNLGGPDGGIGSLGFRDHALGDAQEGGWTADAPILYPHLLENTGNESDSYRFQLLSSEGFSVALWTDPDGDGDPADGVLLGFDQRGDGDFADNQDQSPADLDGDGFPEIGPLAPGDSAPLVLQITPSNNARGLVERTRLFAESLATARRRSVEDLSAVGPITLSPMREACAEPGGVIHLCHELANHQSGGFDIDLEVSSELGWFWEILTDPDGDCDPADGRVLFDTNGDGRPDVRVTAGSQVSLVLRATVPVGAPFGTQEIVLLQAEADAPGALRASLQDQVCVDDLFSLSPSYVVSEGTGKSVGAGRSVWFSHRAQWNGPDAAPALLDVTDPPGHTALLFTDPNGDGRPADSVRVTPAQLGALLEARGGSLKVLVRVDVAPATQAGTVVAATLDGLAQGPSFVVRSTPAEAVVAQVATYADDLFTLQENRFSACDRIHALANGLLPSQADRYRLRWIDPVASADLRVQPVASDAGGLASDSIDFSGSVALGDYAVLLEEWDGLSWTETQRHEFQVEPGLLLQGPSTDRSLYARDGDTILATAGLRNQLDTPLEGATLRFLLTDPSGSFYLTENGTFAPIAGDAWTRQVAVPFLAGGELHLESFTTPPLAFPSAGTGSLRAVLVDACGSIVADQSAPFAVEGDTDGDGWDDDYEIFLGTDPEDRDTDDDGLLDPVDGFDDSDGDTLIDALEADADDDGLPDGLEAGLVLADLDPDTDLSVGAFRADADAGATVTDPKVADTDAGGEIDGAEDLDGDGAVGVGEKDPNDRNDDPCAWTAPPEVTGLRVVKIPTGLAWSWDDLSGQDSCVRYHVYGDPSVPPDPAGMAVLVANLSASSWNQDFASLPPGSRLAFYLVRADSPIGGPGPLGLE